MQKNSTEFEALRRAGFQRYKYILRASAPDRFWKRVEKRGPDECWPFTGYRGKSGYGRVSVYGKMYNAHQLAYIFTHGEYDPSLDCCHKCDNPPCCNPNHLFIGTAADNMNDMWRKGRHPREGIKGEDNTNHRLTEDEVIDIRDRCRKGETQRSIAKKYGVNFRTVNLIVLRKNWKHI